MCWRCRRCRPAQKKMESESIHLAEWRARSRMRAAAALLAQGLAVYAVRTVRAQSAADLSAFSGSDMAVLAASEAHCDEEHQGQEVRSVQGGQEEPMMCQQTPEE